jgi:hypothetical protein
LKKVKRTMKRPLRKIISKGKTNRSGKFNSFLLVKRSLKRKVSLKLLCKLKSNSHAKSLN